MVASMEIIKLCFPVCAVISSENADVLWAMYCEEDPFAWGLNSLKIDETLHDWLA